MMTQNFMIFSFGLLFLCFSSVIVILKTPQLSSTLESWYTSSSLSWNDSSSSSPNESSPYRWNESLTIYVRVTPDDTIARQVLRNSWFGEAKKLGIKTYFILGLPKNLTYLPTLELEEKKYKDMIIFPTFTDIYHAMSLKTREMFRWHLNFSNTNFLFWSNSDAIVFPKKLLTFISAEVTSEDAIYGSCTCNGSCTDSQILSAPYRNTSFKWHIPESLWPSETIPEYCHGHGVLLSYYTIERLMEISDNKSEAFIKEFWIDDVLYGGVFRVEAGIPLISFDNYFFYSMDGLKCLIKELPCIALHLDGLWNNEESIRYYRNRLLQAKYYAQGFKSDIIDIEIWNSLLYWNVTMLR